MAELWRGVEAFFAGLGFAFSVPKVRRTLWAVLAITMIVFVAALVLGAFAASWLGDVVIPALGLEGWQATLAHALALALGLVFGLFLYWVLAPLAVSPWVEAACAAALQALGGAPGRRSWLQAWRAALAALLWGVRGFLAWALISLALWFVPALGALLAPLAWSVAGAKLLVPELVEPAAAVLGMDEAALRAELSRRFWLGFGLVASWMSVAPLVGQLVPVIGAVAATKALAEAKPRE